MGGIRPCEPCEKSLLLHKEVMKVWIQTQFPKKLQYLFQFIFPINISRRIQQTFLEETNAKYWPDIEYCLAIEWNLKQLKSNKEAMVGRARPWIPIFVICQLNKTIILFGFNSANFGNKINANFWITNEFLTVCCGVRGSALAPHTDIRGFEPQCDGRLSSLTCWQL